MDIPLVFKEMAVVLAVEKQDAKMMSHEFLVQCGIVDSSWKLATKPVTSENGSLIRYANNFAIASNSKQIQIVQPFSGDPTEVQVPKMAIRYSEILNTLTYRAVGLNFRSFADLSGISQSPNEFILGFLHPQKINTRPQKASFNLSYSFERNNLNLSIVDAALNNEKKGRPGITFVGNCETRFNTADQSNVSDRISASLNLWELDFAKYTTIVTDFLK